MRISKKRGSLLRELESIVGNEFFNATTQNRGAGGVFLGEGREIRYPITFTDKMGKSTKRWSTSADLSADVLMTGRYICGVNHLHIMKALDKVLQYLEQEHGLKI
jgi:hypothetical protein